jgi:hypothetical protein
VKRYVVPLVVVLALVLAVGALAAWQATRRDLARTRTTQQRIREDLAKAQARQQHIEARQQQADEQAHSLVESLGSLCSGFDFFYKHDMARGAYRPVRCSSAGSHRTVLFAYGFDAPRTQEAWVSEWGRLADERGVTLVGKGTWAVEVLEPRILNKIRPILLQP